MEKLKPDKQASNRLNNSNIAKEGEPYRWKPGVSGNPNGRPPNEMSITAQLRKILEEKNGQGYEIVAKSIYRTLKDLDEKHSASILKDAQDRLEGKAPDVLTITPDSKITFTVRYEDEEKETNVPT
jgi:hypothetical protein